MEQQEDEEELREAARTGQLERLTFLLASGVDKEGKDDDDWTALHIAAFKGQGACLRALLAAGSDTAGLTNQQKGEIGNTALHLASARGHADCVHALLSAGADVEAKDVEFSAALHYAAENGHEACVGALLAAGADKEATDEAGFTPLQRATQSQMSHAAAASCVVLLAAWGADPLPHPTDTTILVPHAVASAVRARMAALQPVVVAAAVARLAAVAHERDAAAAAAATAGPDAPVELMELLRATAMVSHVAKALSCFREDAFKKLEGAKASGSLDCVEYNAISTWGREIPLQAAAADAAAALRAAMVVLQDAQARQQMVVDLRLMPSVVDGVGSSSGGERALFMQERVRSTLMGAHTA